MNLLLLSPEELDDGGEATLRDRRLLHAREVLRASEGDQLRVGVRNGKLGTATVLSLTDAELKLKVALTDEPPPRARVDVLLAIPRPKQLKRVIPAIVSLGVDRLVLVNASRVEKSYFDSKVLTDEFVDGLVVQGLEQARDTRAPTIQLKERFRPFVEDELDGHFGPSMRLLPHPPATNGLSQLTPAHERTVLAIGPEGGWVPFEVELLEKQRFVPFTLGPRILRTEAAVPLLIGQVLLWSRASAAPR